MTRDEIIKMLGWLNSVRPEDSDLLRRIMDVVASEREECAKVCEEHWRHSGNAMNCADAIRSRGKE